MNPQDIKNSIAQKMSKAGNKVKNFLKPNIAQASKNTSPVPRTPNFNFINEAPAIANNRLYQGKYPYAVAAGNTDYEFAPPGRSSRVYGFNATSTEGNPYAGTYYSGMEKPFLERRFNVVNGKGVQGDYVPNANQAETMKILNELKQTPLYDLYKAEGGKSW